MILNHKQQELIERLTKEIEVKFPEVKFLEAVPSPEGESTILLHFKQPDNDDRFIELIEYASERTMDILLDYGYHFVVLPVVADGQTTATA